MLIRSRKEKDGGGKRFTGAKVSNSNKRDGRRRGRRKVDHVKEKETIFSDRTIFPRHSACVQHSYR